MKATISLKKDRIQMKGNGKRIDIPLELKKGNPCSERCDEKNEIRQLYQVLQGTQDQVELN